MIAHTYNKLEIVKQESLAVEHLFDGGRQQYVHVVVKNQPFNIVISSVGKTFNFNHAQVTAKLYYDHNPPKAVDYIQHEPLQYTSTAGSSGTDISVEVKIAILSSQHQGSLFVVIMNIVDTVTTESHCIASYPTRIVSKVDHIKKEGGDSLKKKSFNEILHERLHDMERLQEEQAKMVEYMLRYRQGEVSAIAPIELLGPSDSDDNDMIHDEPEERIDFQTAFNGIVRAFRNVPGESDGKATKVRAMLASLSPDDLDQVSQLVESLASLTNKPVLPDRAAAAASSDCSCLGCPARQEVENFQNLCTLGPSFIETPADKAADPTQLLPLQSDAQIYQSLLSSPANTQLLHQLASGMAGFDWMAETGALSSMNPPAGVDPVLFRQIQQQQQHLLQQLVQQQQRRPDAFSQGIPPLKLENFGSPVQMFNFGDELSHPSEVHPTACSPRS